MNIVFMGTPDFSVGCLQALLDSAHNIIGVFTREDKPKNRGMSLTMPPVKELALTQNLPIFQPKSLKNDQVFSTLAQLNPDLIVVVAYGRILPKQLLELPKYGCINVHASLLPKYRGASPIQTAIVCGEDKSGVTIMKMGEGVDTGDMLYAKEIPIESTDTGGTLHDKLAGLGAQALMECIDLMEQGKLTPVPQDDDLATHAPIITKADGKVSFDKPAKGVANQIMGYSPWPGAFAQLGQVTLKLFDAQIIDTEKTTIGAILSVTENGMTVGCAPGAVVIKEVQKAGGKRMKALDFFHGKPELLKEQFI